ncbi:hypothetical protein Patl1_00448 [Pistacia atlantica]|uniref:Uncharacterized protein n=1 Tax=Pistacia atlantica TaxID=434234 RepID=A0ACC1C9C9_9ROSI|nr:hypothetical protein Patl1_00448 [Pistacia atlantica]
MYAKCKDLGASIRVFDGNWKKNLISWRIMIRSCVENDCTRKALGFFSLMQFRCFEPDETMIGHILVALLQLEETTFGLSFHCYILKKGFLNFSFLGTSLLHMYAKFGELGMARNLFDQLIHKDLIAWSAMISVYAQGGQPYNALTTFKQMQLKNEKPNEFTFVSLLLACSSVGAQELGESWSWFHSMKEKYDITPKLSHYACMVDLLSHQGKVEEALEFVKKMPVKPDKRIWGTLISGCRLVRGSIEIAEYVVE